MRLHYRAAWLCLLGLARAAWGYRRIGLEHVPVSGPAIIACNHVSFWDPILVGLGCRREVHFMAKEELFRNPLFGWIIRAFNAVPVRRGAVDSGALRTAVEVLRSGGVLVIFPGGTRDRSDELRNPKPGVGFLALAAGAPVVPAHIAGSDRLLRAFVGASKLELRLGVPMAADGERTRAGYREFAGRVAEAIRRLKSEGSRA